MFLELPAPTQDEVAALAVAVKKKVEKLLRKQACCGRNEAEGQAAETLGERLCEASVAGRIAQRPKAGWRVRR